MATAKKMPPKGGANTVDKLVQNITNRFRVTAREARDIVTAVSTAAEYRNNENQGSYSILKKDVGTQIKEVGKAAITGKKQTKPLQVQSGVITRNTKRK